jgi:hypothetical protein
VKKGTKRSAKNGAKALSLTDKKGTDPTSSVGKAKRRRHDGPPEQPVAKQPVAKDWQPTTGKDHKATRLKSLVTNHQGRSRSFWENAAFCSVVLGLYLKHRSGELAKLASRVKPDWAAFYRFAAALFGMSDKLAAPLWKWFYDRDGRGHKGGEILVNVSKRGLASPNYKIKDARLLLPEHVSAIEDFILECHGSNGGGRVTLASIRQMLREKFKAKRPAGLPEDKELPGLDVSRSVLRYCLVRQLGYRWGKIRKKARKRDADRPALLRSYLLRYSEALQLEAQNKAVIVYFDEVCCCNAHAYSFLFTFVYCCCCTELHSPEPCARFIMDQRRWIRRPLLFERLSLDHSARHYQVRSPRT